MIKRLAPLFLLSIFSVSSVWAEPVAAQAVPSEIERRISGAKTALDVIMATQDRSIPEELLAKCKAIVIYPRSIKGAFIFGARYGRGVVLKKGDDGKWGPVAFSILIGGNAGFQIGGQMTDYFLLIMNEQGLSALLSDSITLGADASFAAGPIGRKSAASTDLSLKAGILTYAHSIGLFGGVSLDGAVLTQDNAANAVYYGHPVTSREILFGNAVVPQPSSEDLIDALNRYSDLWFTTAHDNLPTESTEKADFQGYVESIDYNDSSVTLIDSRPMADPAQGKVANLKVKMKSKDLASLRLEDEIQVFFDKSGKQKEAYRIIKLPSRRGQ